MTTVIENDSQKSGRLEVGTPLLEVKDLHVEFHTRDGVAKAVNGVNYSVAAGETLAVLGESGSGKSVTAQTIMGILDMPPGKVTQGEILYRGQDMLKMSNEERRKIRGRKIAMIFQDALSALNPVLSVGYQLGEMFRVHQGVSKAEAKAKAIELMDRVRIPAAKERVNDYPHQFSGGMRQRIMIAMALSLQPDLIIADEPTTALDVTVQAQVMDLLAELQAEYNMGLILIDRPGARAVREPRAPVHQGPAALDPAPGPEGPGAVRDQGSAPEPAEGSGRLRVQPPLRRRHRPVPHGDPGAAPRDGQGRQGAHRPPQRVPPLEGDPPWLRTSWRSRTWSSTTR